MVRDILNCEIKVVAMSQASLAKIDIDESYMFRLSLWQIRPSVRPSVTSVLCAIATDVVNSSFESFLSSFRKINVDR